MEGLPMTGTVTYELPMTLVLSLDGDGAAGFRDLCADHRQMMVDAFFANLLAAANSMAPPGNLLIRGGDLDEEARRVLGTTAT